MTADRGRVEAACRAYYGDGWLDNHSTSQARRVAMSRALAAADTLAPPPVLEDVRRHLDTVARGIGRALTLLPTPAPPAGTGDVVQIETRVEELAKRDAGRIRELEEALRELLRIINATATDGLPAAVERARVIIGGREHGRE